MPDVEKDPKVVANRVAGCTCRWSMQTRIARTFTASSTVRWPDITGISITCRLHRDPKLNKCEDSNCPGCWTCRGEFWRNPDDVEG